jgi:hypothetical protein
MSRVSRMAFGPEPLPNDPAAALLPGSFRTETQKGGQTIGGLCLFRDTRQLQFQLANPLRQVLVLLPDAHKIDIAGPELVDVVLQPPARSHDPPGHVHPVMAASRSRCPVFQFHVYMEK